MELGHPVEYDDLDRYRDYRKLFLDSDLGKKVLYDILSMGGMYKSSIKPKGGNPVDPLMVAFKEGERNFALRLLTIINTEPRKPKNNRRKP